MAPFHYVEFNVFCQATEDHEKVIRALKFFTGEHGIAEEEAEGFCGNPLIILRSMLRHKKDIDGFWKRVADSGIVPELVEDLGKRMDDESNLYIRFSKQMAYQGKMVLSKGGGVVEMRAKVEAYPAKKEVAVEAAETYLRTLLA